MSPFDLPYLAGWHNLLHTLEGRGFTALQALAAAPGLMQGQLNRQSLMLAYVDCFRLLAVAFLCIIPLALFIRRPPRGAGGGAMH